MTTPSLRWRRLVATLRALREQSGLTIAQVARRAGFSQSKLSRIESLHIRINSDDTHTLCEVLGVDDGTTQALVHLARESRKRGWWHVYPDDILGKFANFIEMETDARAINSFELDLIPGIFQTREYAEAVIRHSYPDTDNETITSRVNLRIDRQNRWLDGKFSYWAIVDESALHRPIGGPAVMANQLDQVVALASASQVTYQVLPTDITGHVSLGAPHAIVHLQDGSTFVHMDTLTGGLYLDEQTDIHVYEQAWKVLSATAFPADKSIDLTRRLAKRHRTKKTDTLSKTAQEFQSAAVTLSRRANR